MINAARWVLMAVSFVFLSKPLAYPAVTDLLPAYQKGVGIQRFMNKCKNGETVNLLFFGQSNIEDNAAGAYTRTIWEDLKRRFPTATINYLNSAVGACDASCMLNGQINGRIAGKNADLVVLLIWGWETPFEQLIDRIKADSPPTAEILVFNWHIGSFANPDELQWHNYMSWYWMPDMCRRRSLGWCDLLTGYLKYLNDNHGGINGYRNVLPDGMHHNAEGAYLMGELIKPYFVLRNETTPPAIDSVYTIGGSKLFIRFSKYITKASAETAANYSLSLQGQVVGVESATLGSDGRTVTLEVSGRCEGSLTVTAVNISDELTPPNIASTPTSKTVSLAAPPGWNFAPIGYMGTINPKVEATGETAFRIIGGGENIYERKNEHVYYYKTIRGDGEIVAKIEEFNRTHDNANAGLLIREDCQYASKYAALVYTPAQAQQFKFITRNDRTLPFTNVATASGADQWLKLGRSGSSIAAYKSTNGTSWTKIGEAPVALSSEISIGAYLCGGRYATASGAGFSGVSVSGGEVPTISASRVIGSAATRSPLRSRVRFSGTLSRIDGKSISANRGSAAAGFFVSASDAGWVGLFVPRRCAVIASNDQ